MKIDLKELINKVLNAPVVVETGTSGIWTYRKWSDGTAECWGIWSGSLTHYSTYGSFFAYVATIAYPTGLFATGSEPIVTYQPTVNGGFAMPGTHFMSGPVRTNYYAVASASGTQDVAFSIHVKGKWK